MPAGRRDDPGRLSAGQRQARARLARSACADPRTPARRGGSFRRGSRRGWAASPARCPRPEIVEVEPGRLLLFATWFDRSDPARPLFDPVTEGILRSRLLRAVSTDSGCSWSAWEAVPTPGLTGCASTGPVVRWPDGTLAYAFESFKEYDDPRPARHAAWVVVSRDDGRTFSEPLLVAQDPNHEVYYWDQRLCPAGEGGEFIALFWTHDRKQKRDLSVHIRRGRITDPGIELTPIQQTPIPGQIAAPLLLEDGRLLAFVVDRDRPGTMKLWASPDGGATWPADDCLLVHAHEERAALSQGRDNIDFKQYWEDMGKWSFGHPAIRPLGGDRVLLAWYAGTPEAMSIHWASGCGWADRPCCYYLVPSLPYTTPAGLDDIFGYPLVVDVHVAATLHAPPVITSGALEFGKLKAVNPLALPHQVKPRRSFRPCPLITSATIMRVRAAVGDLVASDCLPASRPCRAAGKLVLLVAVRLCPAVGRFASLASLNHPAG